MAERSKILVIGGTGYVGKFLVEESAKTGHPTFALVRESAASHPDKSKIIESFKSSGVTVIFGDIYNHERLVSIIKQVDVVISAVARQQSVDQVNIIAAIKEAGNIKRFLPSEFGFDVDKIHAVDPAASVFKIKAQIRRTIEAEGIPYTYVACNALAAYFLRNLGQLDEATTPRDKVVILGDGNSKAIFVKKEDVATYPIKAVDDPRTLNKLLYMSPPANILSSNELVFLWENKIGKTLERTYILEDQLLKNIQDHLRTGFGAEAPMPLKFILSICYAAFVKGDVSKIEVDASGSVEASQLYPDVRYTTVDEFLNQFV